MSAPRFKPGDKVTIQWMGDSVAAYVDGRVGVSGGVNVYRLLIPGVMGRPMYDEDEIEPAVGCE